jgi:hypothetical protein|tara:strand:+ start:887 stop:1321 length:435 start_codon:yes stop_codon:yes gene_type:complete
MIKLKDILVELKEVMNYQFQQEDVDFDEMDNSLLGATYTFKTPNNQYRVELYSGEYNPEDMKFDLSFGLDKGPGYKLDTFQMTGEGNVRTILNTIGQIIQDFLEEYPEVETIIVKGTDDKRTRVYKALLPKYLSNHIRSKVHIE